MTNEERAREWLRTRAPSGLATLLDEAEQRGRDAGLEEAALECCAGMIRPGETFSSSPSDMGKVFAKRIRALKSGGGT